MVRFLAHSAHYPIRSCGWDLCLPVHHCVDLHTLHCTTQVPGGPAPQGSQFSTHMLPEYGAWKFTMTMLFQDEDIFQQCCAHYKDTKVLISKHAVFLFFTVVQAVL